MKKLASEGSKLEGEMVGIWGAPLILKFETAPPETERRQYALNFTTTQTTGFPFLLPFVCINHIPCTLHLDLVLLTQIIIFPCDLIA